MIVRRNVRERVDVPSLRATRMWGLSHIYDDDRAFYTISSGFVRVGRLAEMNQLWRNDHPTGNRRDFTDTYYLEICGRYFEFDGGVADANKDEDKETRDDESV